MLSPLVPHPVEILVLLLIAGVLIVGIVALVLFLTKRSQPTRSDVHPLPSDVEGLRREVEGLRREVTALQGETADALRHLAVVRYDAFGDVGGHLSWSLALLDDGGNGVVLTSIHGRSEARTYAKSIADWSCEQQLSPEEDEAISHARPSDRR